MNSVADNDDREAFMELVVIVGSSSPSLLAFLAVGAETPEILPAPVMFIIAIASVALALYMDSLREKRKDEMDERIKQAIKLQLETQNHSEEWYAQAVRERRTEILQSAPEVREREASRRLRGNRTEKEYHELAAHAAKRYGHDADEIAELLRKADELPYRLLDTATKLEQDNPAQKARASHA